MTTTTSKTTLTGREAIAYAREHGLDVQKYADPTEGARSLTPDQADQIAREDPSLLWVEVQLVEAASEHEPKITVDPDGCEAYDRGHEYARVHGDTIATIASDAERIYNAALADATASDALLDTRQAMRDALAAGDLGRARVLADDWTRGRIDGAR